MTCLFWERNVPSLEPAFLRPFVLGQGRPVLGFFSGSLEVGWVACSLRDLGSEGWDEDKVGMGKGLVEGTEFKP